MQLFIIFTACPAWASCWTLPGAVIAFAFNEGAYCAETMRGALESVPQGQLEAGYCVGMSWWQIMRRIVLPQALRTAVPALSNSLIGMIKDTSLASNITVAELFMAGQRVAARTYIFLPIYCEVAVVYLLFLYRHHQAARAAGAPAQRPRLPVRKECGCYGNVRDTRRPQILPYLRKARRPSRHLWPRPQADQQP